MKWATVALTCLALGMFVAAGTGCATSGGGGGGGPTGNTNANTGGDNTNANTGGDNTNANTPTDNTNANANDNGASEQPALIKTHVSLEHSGISDSSGKIDVGNDLIVFGIADEGVFYLVPTQADSQTNTATMIPNSDQLFGTADFEVTGKMVALVRSTYAVSIYDTTTGALTDIPSGDITLDRFAMSTDANQPGQMVSDGDFIATINDTTEVTDGNAIKVINLGTAPPGVISFPTPEDFEGDFKQVAVDAETRRVAAHGTNPGDILYIFDLDNPQATPLSFDFFDRGGFTDNIQMGFEGNYIIYQDDSFDGDWEIALLNVSTDTITVFTNNPTQNGQPVVLAGGSFGYFIWREDADAISGATSQYRTAIGHVADAPASTLAAQFDSIFGGNPPDCVQDYSRFGYGTTMCLTPDGSRWFTAGIGAITENYDYLQMSTGGAFDTFTDPDGDTYSGLVMATDVACSSTTVAFRALRQTPTDGCFADNDWVIGFIVLDRLH